MSTRPAPWDHAANCAAAPASYAKAMGWEARHWESIHEVPTQCGAVVVDRFGRTWVHLHHRWVRITYKDSTNVTHKTPLEESGPFTEPYLTFE